MKVLIELEESEVRDIIRALEIARDGCARLLGGRQGAEMYHVFSKILEKLDKWNLQRELKSLEDKETEG